MQLMKINDNCTQHRKMLKHNMDHFTSIGMAIIFKTNKQANKNN